MRRRHSSLIRALRDDPRVLQRFWKYVQLTDDANDCWVWTGPLAPGGYPAFRIAGRSLAASHVTWFTEVGELPEGGRVKRQCGNVLCVRPTHLAWALSPVLQRAVESIGDGYLEPGGHAFTPGGRRPCDPRFLRSVFRGTTSTSRGDPHSPDPDDGGADAA